MEEELLKYISVTMLLNPTNLMAMNDEDLGKAIRPMIAAAKLMWVAETLVRNAPNN